MVVLPGRGNARVMACPKPYQKVVVHCGLPKTGSSYLQLLCHGNSDALARHGIDYPLFTRQRARGPRRNHSVVMKSYVPGGDVWDHISGRLSLRPDCPTLLLSAEGFLKASRASEFLNGFLEPFSRAELKFVVYIRRFDHLVESVYAQLVKTKLFGDISAVGVRLDFDRKIARLAQVVDEAAISSDPIIEGCGLAVSWERISVSR